MLKLHCGLPNSAAIGCTGSAPVPLRRYRFHQPVRSDTKYKMPSGDHSGWKIDSSGPPATFSRAPGVPSAESAAVHNSVPSHGMLGCRHCSQASDRPSGLTIGSE